MYINEVLKKRIPRVSVYILDVCTMKTEVCQGDFTDCRLQILNGGSGGASRAELSQAGWAVSRVLEELYWRRLVFHYLLFPAERSRLGHLITVYYRKTAARLNEKSFPGGEAGDQLVTSSASSIMAAVRERNKLLNIRRVRSADALAASQ